MKLRLGSLVLYVLAGMVSGAAYSADSDQPLMSSELSDSIALQQARRQVVSNAVVQEAVLSDDQASDVAGEVGVGQSLPEDEAVLAKLVDQTAIDDVISGSAIGIYKVSGYACNVVNTPDENRVWAIHLYNFESSLTDSEVVFGLAENRKIQSVACTPDGSFMLFSVKDTTAGDYEIYRMDLSTRALTQLTDNDTDDVDVTLSADGLKMAWQERLADGRQAIAMRTYSDPNTFTQQSLGSANPFVQPSLSANGNWLALVQLRTNYFLALRYDTETNEYLIVKRNLRRKKLFHPSVSDDGLRFGWLQNNTQSSYLVKNLVNGRQSVILINSEGISHPVISPNGEWVIYSYNNTHDRSTRLTHLATGITADIGNRIADSTRYLAAYWQGSSVREVLVPVTGRLNDTGITQCADGSTNGLSCPISGYSDQDAQYGRDFEVNDDSDGHAGFNFTKLDANGNELLANAMEWSCVKDNVTGLIWEVKQGGNGTRGDEGLHDADDSYTWYSTDTNNDGGSAGSDGINTNCHGYHSGDATSYCNTEAYVNRVNTQRLCGASNWRLPKREELRSIVSYDRVRPSIDTEYFPNTKISSYWSSSPYAGHSDYAWYVNFNYRYGLINLKGWDYYYVRLVRGGQ